MLVDEANTMDISHKEQDDEHADRREDNSNTKVCETGEDDPQYITVSPPGRSNQAQLIDPLQ